MAERGGIGSWTEGQLALYVRNMIQLLSPDTFTGLTVDDLIVVGSLTSQGSVDFGRLLSHVGTSGQPAFTNGWANLGGSAQTAVFWKNESGIVTLEGTITAGTLGATAFTLPPGFRPSADRFFPAYSNATLGLVKVTSGGLVQPLAVGTASNASYSLDAIRFRTGTI